MYLNDVMIKNNKESRINYILSTVLKIKNIEIKNIESNIKDEKKLINFLSEKMLEEVKKALK